MHRWIDDDLDRANDAANRAATAAVAALGVFELIDRFRFRDPAAPVPAPGADTAPEIVRQAALAALHATASTRILHEGLRERAVPADVAERTIPDLAGLGTVVDLDDADVRHDYDALVAARSTAEQSAADARRALRRVAQVGLGVAQYAYEDDDTELVERACLTILVDSTAAVLRPVDDDHGVRGRTRDEVGVELAGVLARFLAVPLATARLELTAPGTPVRSIGIADDGGLWVDGLGTFRTPVTIREVVDALLDVATDVDGVHPRDLTVTWLIDDHT